jgi:AcrR family transcriptional regulator
MARLKSDEKRNGLLAAAAAVFAEKGLSAPTAAITAQAGVAEGTLFTYFKTKNDLINALYREIKLELADAMMSDFPRRTSVRHRLEHVWNRYVDWGAANVINHKVLKEIEMWDGLTGESQAAGCAPFAEIEVMANDAVAQHVLRDLPLDFICAVFSSLATTTMEFMRNDPKKAAELRRAGFETLWAGLTTQRGRGEVKGKEKKARGPGK